MAIRLESSIDDLARQVAGPVLVAGDERIAQEAFPFNAAIQHAPDVVVGATCAQDVQAAVRFAAANGLRVSVQATGHGAVSPIEGGCSSPRSGCSTCPSTRPDAPPSSAPA